MTKTREAFAGGKAFIPFLTAGDPSLAVTEELIVELASAGADLIEIGIPFSDPVAEGPVIQGADARALAAGTTTDGIFEMVRRVREKTGVPLAFMTYINPVYRYGSERFVKQCAELGVDALIVPDLPFEEKGELQPYCAECGVDLVSLIAPTSKERIRTIAREAEGFLYCVSSLGVTGVRTAITTDVGEMVSLVREVSDIPCAIGFGIATPQQAEEMARKADGAIVGSAVMKIIARYGPDCVPHVTAYAQEIARAVHGAR